MVYREILGTSKELYDGVRIGFQHNFWILKSNVQKVTNKITGVIVRDHEDSNVMDGSKKNVEGFKVVGVGFGRTGTVGADVITKLNGRQIQFEILKF